MDRPQPVASLRAVPGRPEWEARTRTRFEESNGGEWKPAETDVI